MYLPMKRGEEMHKKNTNLDIYNFHNGVDAGFDI